MCRIDWAWPAWGAAWALVVTLSIGCAGAESLGVSRADEAFSLPTAHHILGVPFVPGEPGACGPAALASVLGYHDDPVSVEDIAQAIGAPSLAGVLPLDLERYAAARPRGAMVRTGTGSLVWLRKQVASDHPVVAFLDLGFGPIRQGHFVVVVGYDDRAERVLVYSGKDADASMAYGRFISAWRRAAFWALMFDPRVSDPLGTPSAS